MTVEELLHLFVDEKPKQYTIKNTSRGNDFREVMIAEWEHGVLQKELNDHLVVKVADNGFTTPDRIAMWKRCAEEYRKLGYYCPHIFMTREGAFPYIDYNGKRCVVYGEEYSRYRSAEDFGSETVHVNGYFTYIDDAILMNAKVASQYFDYTDFPSGYCLFEKFDPTDVDDEVMLNALEWKSIADKLPSAFNCRTDKIWRRWNQNKEELRKIYAELPRSVFQADINHTNCLLDDDKNFKGVYDFNLAGRDVFINYLFREIPYVMTTDAFHASEAEDYVVACIMHAIKISKQVYTFHDVEKKAAILLYRCIKPLWFVEVEKLKRAGDDFAAINECLAKTEYIQTREIDFAGAMS